MYELGLEYRRQIIWNYENGWSRYRRAPACHYEPILWFARSQKSTFHVIREPYKSTDRLRHTITKNGKVWTPHPHGKQSGDVWRFPTLAGRRFAEERTEHPTQKPLPLSRRIVEHFSNPGRSRCRARSLDPVRNALPPWRQDAASSGLRSIGVTWRSQGGASIRPHLNLAPLMCGQRRRSARNCSDPSLMLK